ncbi:2-C-methyl-D-erythritol 4-phosphate cytidylyltransferase [Rhodococcus sp. PvR044]|jgi:2-C-methyl-D-erythritol 4-phosphate cytidylyltransferase|uniref:2-C-methyl-D-erythritol 4-phosphate cytidylyltransferase n=1 Tax=Rhodococcus TaxID=1827 RepID=UPI000BCD363D|nr:MULTISPECIES: 2-C-methyl-D-erythritol 4-phosphate cytidylyltransferase [Rhodococcus]MCZ4557303.1 2-C-methyl-D-erythritol 4-phosphate cytidylyltransferase [Rhodococcus maanshanensis]PTR40080.1 2-C-methyl-D-erythritol 4-phosphate cytidylyltransferase [Rhodococcus sp. OK611]SNX92547.1 2-C-methyl-D-erythritol 4-phosphate cytidylyltransferase [Rhodococcus sp. OK270]
MNNVTDPAEVRSGGRVIALVPAAGRGERLGEGIPKAFVTVRGVSMLRLAVEGLIESGVVDRVVVIVPADRIDSVRAELPEGVDVVAGGAERTDSVRAGLAAAEDADLLLVHDAARALTPPPLIARVVAELRAGRDAVVPALPVSDTIKTVDLLGAVTGTPERSELRAVQTPQGFTADLLRRAYAAADSLATDDAGLVERIGGRVRTIVGDPLAFKITTPLDLALARALANDEPIEQ